MEHVIYERPDIARGFRSDQENFFITTKKASFKDRICLSPMVKYVIPAFIVMALLMGAVYLTMYFVLTDSDNDWPATCNIRPSYHVECFPGRNETGQLTYEECIAVGCCWQDKTKLCFHSIPSRNGYTPKNSGSYKENEPLIPRRSTSPLGSKNAESVAIERRDIDANHVKIILKISQAGTRAKTNVQEYSSRNEKFSSSSKKGTADELSKKLLYFLPENPERRTVNFQNDVKSNMDVYLHSPEFSVTVTRKTDTIAQPILSTARGPLILTDTFWELTLYITNNTLYGLNQLQLNGTTNLIYNNEYGTAWPAFLGIDENGLGTSCYVSYDGPMEIQVRNESNLVILRGLSLPREISLNVFAGPSPLDAVKQLTNAVRKDSKMEDISPSSLGLHVCPNDDSSDLIESLTSTIDNLAKRSAPWDSHCLHQGFNPTLGNTLDATHLAIVDEARKLLANDEGDGGRILVPHLSPMIFNDGNELAAQLADSSLLLRDSSGPYVGLYRNQSVVYPDWFNNRTSDAALSNLTDYLTQFAVSKLLYVRDSWPKDESTGHSAPANLGFDYLPKGMKNLVTSGTVPYTLRTSSRSNSHYAEHNAYSAKFHDTSMLQGWTSLTIHGLWGESGNSSWAALRAAIRVGVSSGLVGQLPPPMYICGTGEDLGPSDNNDELCSRWYGAAVAWPHVLVLPENLPGGIHLTASSSSYAVKHLKLRASLLSYMRTTLAKHYIDGSPVLSPTSIYYPQDLHARNRWNQFFWGNSILVGLVTLPSVKQVPMWLPGKYPWKHLHGGSEVYPSNSTTTSIPIVESQIVTLIRPKYIVPLHEEISMTSAATLKNPLTLVINLVCDEDCYAWGEIFYGESDGEFLSITANSTTLQLTNILKVQERACNPRTSTQQPTLIKYVEILGTPPYKITNCDNSTPGEGCELCSLGTDSHSIIFNNFS